jgi:hypothetical protein
MITNQAIEEMGHWATAAQQGRFDDAKTHVQKLYHLGASFIASHEFQNVWEKAHGERLEPPALDCFCKFLNAIAEIEANQLQAQGHAKD